MSDGNMPSSWGKNPEEDWKQYIELANWRISLSNEVLTLKNRIAKEEPVVKAALALDAYASEFGGDLHDAGEFFNALWDACDLYKAN